MNAQAGPSSDAALVSGEAVELDVRVARVGSRAVALLLDVIVQAGMLLALIPLALLGAELTLRYVDDALVQGLMVGCLVLVLVGYPVAAETLTSGRTAGKSALGLRVVRDDGGPIRFRHALTRALVGVSIEWPGLVLAPLTWIVSLITVLAQPRGKRLGDLAAGTIVIHERTPAAWGWVPGMPPALANWAMVLDITALDDDLALAVRHFLARGHGLAEPERSRLGQALATEVLAVTTPPPPPGVPGWAYLAAVLAERHRRTAHRLVRARAFSARLWPELSTSRPWPQPVPLGGPGSMPATGLPAATGFPSATGPLGGAAMTGGTAATGDAAMTGGAGAAGGTAAPGAGWPSHSWPEPPWREPLVPENAEPDWRGLRPPRVASALRPPTPRDTP